MAKKHAKAHDRSHDEDDDPDAGVPVAEASAPRTKAAKAHGARAAAHGAKGHDDHHHGGPDATEDEASDPSWWVPYAVLGAVVLVGVLGFFGTFNRWLKPMFSPVPVSSAAPAETAQAAAPPPPAPVTNRPPPQLPPDTFGAKHLLVMHKDSRRAPPGITRTKEEALARAKEALAKAKAPGAKFEEVVAAYSDEPRAAERGGNLGNFRRGAMVKEFQEGLEKTKVGEISDIVETPFGYHVILRTR